MDKYNMFSYTGPVLCGVCGTELDIMSYCNKCNKTVDIQKQLKKHRKEYY